MILSAKSPNVIFLPHLYAILSLTSCEHSITVRAILCFFAEEFKTSSEKYCLYGLSLTPYPDNSSPNSDSVSEIILSISFTDNSFTEFFLAFSNTNFKIS